MFSEISLFPGLLGASSLYPGVAVIVKFSIAAALLLAFWRLIKGPDHTDRVVVLDFITGAFICLVLFHAIEQRSALYLGVALILAVISFLGTVSLARFLTTRKPRQYD